jgi:membrane fusion protein (multidrug efflux system)
MTRRFSTIATQFRREALMTAPMVRAAALLLSATVLFTACRRATSDTPEAAPSASSFAGRPQVLVVDSLLPDVTEAAGTAAPMLRATLATKLMATVTAVHVHEGDMVSAGQLLVSLDVRDIDARSAQAAGSLQSAEAMLSDAEVQTARMRALYADSAAPKAQLDAAEAGLARARALVHAARGGVAEADAVREYGALRAPFAGVVTQRLVDPGAFAAPGMPLVTVQQSTTLRVSAAVPPTAASALSRGVEITLRIEGTEARGTIEGVVAAPSGGLFTVNVVVPNPDGALPTGGSATLLLPGAPRSVRLVPAEAITREGDLTGVLVRTPAGADRRWVRLGRTRGGFIEVLSGVNAGDTLLLPRAAEDRA